MKELNFKKQIINMLTESLNSGDKTNVKGLIKLIKENKDLRDLYLFYNDVEKKHMDNKEIATEYVNVLSEQLKGKISIIKNSNIQSLFSEKYDENLVENEELYLHLDTLLENDTIRNIDSKILAKKYIINYLTEEREIEEDEDTIDETINEGILNSVLVTNFNIYYENVLSEDEKIELKSILDIPECDFNNEFMNLKEEVSTKLNSLINENSGELKEKLELSKTELDSMKSSKLNFYKITQLKNGL